MILCCGLTWRSRWCVLDQLFGCRWAAICDRHDAHILGWSLARFRNGPVLLPEEDF